MKAPRQDDQKGFNKDNGSYQNTRGYFRENNFRESRSRGRGRGAREKEGNPPGRIIIIVRDRAPKKETTRREVVVVEDKIIKIEAGDMTNSHNIVADTVPHNRNNINICHRPQPHPKAFSQHLHHMIQTGN